jgi:hypothetical protein
MPMSRLMLAVCTCFALTACALTRFQTSGGPPQPWPPATGTVIAQTEYGRITTLDDGGYNIELRETPIPPDRSDADRAAAMKAIRAFADSPDLDLSYSGMQRHPENTGIIVEVYDSADTQFMVDIASGQVVYMQTSSLPTSRPGSAVLSPTDLQARATEFVSKKNPCFADVVHHLILEPGDKRDTHFFRWQSPTPDEARPWNQPTFVQVGVDNYGVVFGYVDSGICYLKGR